MKEDFENLIRKFSPTLRRITHKLNGHFTFFDEDDLFQEALEHLWIHYNGDKLRDKTDSYVLQGCYFHLKNYIRGALDKAKLVSLQKMSEESGDKLESFLGREDRSIQDSAENSVIEEKSKLMSRRETIVLKLSMAGLTAREIGARLGISHVMVLKVRKSMRKYFVSGTKTSGAGYQN